MLHQAPGRPALVVGLGEVHLLRPDVELGLVALLVAEVGEENRVLLVHGLIAPAELHDVGGDQREGLAEVLGDVEHVVARPCVVAAPAGGLDGVARFRPGREERPGRPRLVELEGVDLGAVPDSPPGGPPVHRDEVVPLGARHQDGVRIHGALDDVVHDDARRWGGASRDVDLQLVGDVIPLIPAVPAPVQSAFARLHKDRLLVGTQPLDVGHRAIEDDLLDRDLLLRLRKAEQHRNEQKSRDPHDYHSSDGRLGHPGRMKKVTP
mmetsp:Transcript_67290/g.197544  ORF Transcript_67290/g.197544 Transcript_67290/m.197544 type:complete len:265 (+) Transcript_67290:1960-2754(+)